MLDLILGVVAALIGILVGFWLRTASAKAEKALLEKRILEQTAELTAVRAELAKAQAESAAKASFEALAAEREGAIARLEEERNALREDLRLKSEAEPAQAARISQLEADLRNERQNLADQSAHQLSARQTLEAERDTLRDELRAKMQNASEQAGRAAKLEADLNNERQNLAEKLALLESSKQALANQFESLAGKILDEKTRSFSDGSQKELGTLLTPLKTQIEEFRRKVEEAQKESLVGRTQLAAELKQLRNLNENLSTEAHSLSTALRQDTQKQGHWGEFILLKILESSGLKRGLHYTYQESFSVADEETGGARKQQTDVIVQLPEGRHLIIDSKVTLNAYDDYANASNDEERGKALSRLLRSFRDHCAGLAERNYHRIPSLQSPDFVVLFAPLEPAFMLAIQKDDTLWTDAYQKGVLLAGPTTVLFVVRIVESLWRQEIQAKNVQKVMDRGGKLYDKFVGFIEDLESVGDGISEADKSYKQALSKLTTGRENLVRQVEMLRELEVKNKKKLKPKLLDAAGVDEPDEVPSLALAAEAEDGADAE